MVMRAKMALGLGVAALVIGSAAPASAGRYDGRWGHHHRHDDGGAGAVIGAIVGIGIIAAIASAASKKKEAETRTGGYERPYDDRGYGADDRGYDSRADRRSYDDGRPAVSEDEAVDACAVAARDEASRSGGFADIREITGVRPYGRGYDVTGTLDQRSSYSARESRQRSFRCTYEDGRVSGVTFATAI